ncbi:unnamed protein product [Rotaria sordida]|uniref:Uncharacterized protein n=1 Tax=Rotaria sordida TaxID=392033 RepID=A0A814TQS2_9BILA|nr:unnamed protein product [Rotaria sordida]
MQKIEIIFVFIMSFTMIVVATNSNSTQKKAGVDWFVLAKGNAGYIVAGVFKILTLGGFGIWWLVDVIRIGVNKFNDGNGAPLKPW